MSAVNETIVREYFEALGYQVSQPRKYVGPSRQKRVEEEASLLVFNPAVDEHALPEGVLWATTDLRTVRGAVVGVVGWHTDRFFASTLKSQPDILRFAAPEALKLAGRRLGMKRVTVIICLPQLPASEELKDEALAALRAKGIDGVLSFPTMLQDLINGTDKHRNYDKSDLLQIIRIFKCYDFFKGSQMLLFAGRGRRRKKTPAAAPESAPAPET